MMKKSGEGKREKGEKGKSKKGNSIKRELFSPVLLFNVPLFPCSPFPCSPFAFDHELPRHTSIGFAKPAPGETACDPDDDGCDRWRRGHRHDGFIWSGFAAQHALAF